MRLVNRCDLMRERLHIRRVHRHHRVEQEREVDALGLDRQLESIAVSLQRPWSLEGDGDAFKLAVEAKRIDLAFLFDPMMAVHTSNVEPLPHQITAVYESHAATSTASLRVGRRPRCRKDNH